MNASDVPLSASQRSKIRRLSQPVEAAPGEESGELNIIPYLDIVTNILVFVLASVSVTFLSTQDTTPPAMDGKGPRVESKALNLAVLVTHTGVGFKTSGGNIASGCEGVGNTVTVPRTAEQPYDWASVRTCARKLKSASPDFAEEDQVTVTASRDIEYRHLMDAFDALRADSQGELFPDVHLGAAR